MKVGEKYRQINCIHVQDKITLFSLNNSYFLCLLIIVIMLRRILNIKLCFVIKKKKNLINCTPNLLFSSN